MPDKSENARVTSTKALGTETIGLVRDDEGREGPRAALLEQELCSRKRRGCSSEGDGRSVRRRARVSDKSGFRPLGAS
jgi:hypothetical protein